MSMNVVMVIGRLTRDPELKYTPNGVPVANFSVAVDRDVPKNEDGERPTDFFRVTAWRQSAEFVANYVSKGQLIAVRGRLQQRKWQGEDGQNHEIVEIVADRVQNLSPRKDGEGNGNRRVDPPEPTDADDPYARMDS